jgi:hypothetical protein
MTVVVRFELSEAQLRTIRASYGRGGVATRKESSLFINRAVTGALDTAPAPKPKRGVRVTPERPVVAPAVCTCGDGPLCATCRAKRDRILSGKPAKAWRTA